MDKKTETKGYIPLGVVFALRWQLNQKQGKCTCNANDSIWTFNQNEEHTGCCIMNMQMFFFLNISLFVKNIFRVYPMQNILRNLPQRDHKTIGGL